MPHITVLLPCSSSSVSFQNHQSNSPSTRNKLYTTKLGCFSPQKPWTMMTLTAVLNHSTNHYCLNTWWWFLPFVISCLVVVSHPCPQTNPRRRDIGTNKLSDTTINRSLNGTVLALSRRHGTTEKRTSPPVPLKAPDPFLDYPTLFSKKGANVDIDN